MEIIMSFMYASMIIALFGFLIEDYHSIVKWIFAVLISIVKYIMELGSYLQYISSFLIIVLLILYGKCVGHKASNLKRLQLAYVAYGINYIINLLLSFGVGIIAGIFLDECNWLARLAIIVARILVLLGFHRWKNHCEKLKEPWVLNICVVSTTICVFVEEFFRAAYVEHDRIFLVMCIIFTCLAALFTILWLIDHYKMVKIQNMYAVDNRQMSQKLHRSKEILPAIASYVSNMDQEPDEEMRKKLEEICRDYGKELGGREMSAELFDSTGVPLVDLLLRTKMLECEKQDVELDLFVNTRIDGDLKHMDISEGELARMLGDLIQNAMYAVEFIDEKMLLVLIARNEADELLLEIYDSGVPFPEKVLAHFGERGMTTWGTGNGLADMMETLERVDASVDICPNLPGRDVFTKRIRICFDGKKMLQIEKLAE
jgi:hypothetical protein